MNESTAQLYSELDEEPFRNQYGFVNVTLKEIPPELHEQLKDAAARSRRSLNHQIIYTLQSSLASHQTSRDELVTRIQQRRGRLGGFVESADVIEGIQDGRA